jgi:uncharacterized protein DUF3775
MFAPRWGGVARDLSRGLPSERQLKSRYAIAAWRRGTQSRPAPFPSRREAKGPIMPTAAEKKEDAALELPDLGIAAEKVRFIIVKARQFDAKEGDSDPDEGSNASDDGMADVLEDKPESDAVRQELAAFINKGLDEEEQTNLVALAWLGRGTYDIDEWKDALETARTEHNKRTAQYLLGLPLLGDYLADGLEAFGESFDDEDDED